MTMIAIVFLIFLLSARPGSTQISPQAPPGLVSRRIQNIPPEEMWKRVTQCAFPTYPLIPFQSHIIGTVDIGLAISPKGDVENHRVLSGHPLLVQSAVGAINQWKFQPNVVEGEATWSRVRALARFNADGTTAVDLAPARLPDDFGNPGTPLPGSSQATVSGESAIPRPASATACKSEQPWTGAQAQEIESSETSAGLYQNNYFGMTFHFPEDWQTAARATLDSMDASAERAGRSRYDATPANVRVSALPSYLLFFARTDGPIGSPGPSVRIWAEKEVFISSAEQYFPNLNFLRDKTADGTRGPIEVEINGTKYFRGDRWGKVEGRGVYNVRLVTYARNLIVGIDVMANDTASAEQLVKNLAGLKIAPPQ
jgi:TonB family protein